jgi:hypothetical protein
MLFARPISAAALTVVLASGGFGLCAGWAATAEARMACCTEGERCPMHAPKSDGTTRVVTQADADACCAAASAQDGATPSTSAFVPVASLGPLVSPVTIPDPHTRTSVDARHALVPLLASHVSKHLLLSVFLI